MQTEENALETALRKASTEPAERPEFYRVPLESTVFIIGASDQSAEGSTTLEAGSQVQIQNWQRPDGSPVFLFFSSLQALQRAIEGNET